MMCIGQSTKFVGPIEFEIWTIILYGENLNDVTMTSSPIRCLIFAQDDRFDFYEIYLLDI